ncbi:MAG TPA: hypothetical protein VMW69_11690 [Spirochaetia bacterium]|nr:hypothetical protein [Spirochaetia bacterium]
MLTEFAGVRQIPSDGYRRWFTDPDFDLFVWYEDESREQVVGFQLCYNKRSEQKALTWYRGRGYLHTAIDDGEGTPLKNRTPILVADGQFPRERVAREFEAAAKGIDKNLFDLVKHRLAEYPSQVG